jgi:dipeptidase
MCDTLLATPNSTRGSITLFAKNSDRQRNEAQAVQCFSGMEFPDDSYLTCTYISIPQARRVHATVLSRPYWIWGAEMGANEHGVVIGNEGLHARDPAPRENALTGMDYVRLGLERAETASEAVCVITKLLEEFGQGGNCGHMTPNYYNNGFLIADHAEAFVLETVGRDWLTERICQVRSLSNTYSIGRGADRTSAGFAALIRRFGWSRNSTPDYAEVIRDPNREHIGHAGERRARSSSLLQSLDGQLSAIGMMNILRDHGPTNQGIPARGKPDYNVTLCMHAGSDERPGQTVASWVSDLHSRHAVHWVTGTAAPCTSIFKPVLMDVALPAHGPDPTDQFNAKTLWWWHEQLHRAALIDLSAFIADIRRERDELETDMHTRVMAVLGGGSAEERANVVAQCWKDAMETEDRWFARLRGTIPMDEGLYDSTWSEMNRISGMDLRTAERMAVTSINGSAA